MIQNREHDPETREEALAGLCDGRWAVRLQCAVWRHRAAKLHKLAGIGLWLSQRAER